MEYLSNFRGISLIISPHHLNRLNKELLSSMKFYRGLTLTLMAIPLLLAGCATNSLSPDQESELQYVKTFEGVEKQVLYDKSLEWVARTFDSANSVIQLKNPETGQIIGRGISRTSGTPLDFMTKRPFEYTMVIDIKDEKMRASFESVNSIRVGNVAGPNMDFQSDQVIASLEGLVEDLHSFINTEAADDW